MDATHQATTFAIEVRIDFLFESGLIEVARANSDTKSDSLLLGLASNILENSNRGVDTTTLTEECADGTARSLWRNKDDIDIRGYIDLGKILENGRETVREVEGLESQLLSYAEKRLSLPCPWSIGV